MSELSQKTDEIPNINIMTIGDTSVGKTTMILRYTEDKFYEDLISSIGVSVQTKQINIMNDTQPVLLKIWDTAGQERYKSLSQSYYRKADGIFIVFDLSERKTFLKTQNFISSIKELGNEHVAIVLVGNKSDIERSVLKEESQEFADSNSIEYFETSAKLGTNIDEVFKCLAEKAFNQMPGNKKVETVEITVKEEKNGCKC